jgi:N-acetylmuramoyl-L-alanine amidase
VSATILLDPGHGNGDGGVCRNTFRESVWALWLARAISDALVATGWPIICWQTRYDDSTDPSQHARADRAETLKADLTLSLHANSSDPREHGSMALYLPRVPHVAELAGVWLKAMDRRGEYVEPGPSQRVRPMRTQGWACTPGVFWQGRALSVLTPHRKRPCIVLEHGYASHEAEREWLMSSDGRDRCVYAALEVVRELLRLKDLAVGPLCLP